MRRSEMIRRICCFYFGMDGRYATGQGKPAAFQITNKKRNDMLRKICAYPCCDELAVEDGSRCEDHTTVQKQVNTERWQQLQDRPEVAAWRKLYNLRWWRRESKEYLKRNPLCVDCASVGLITAASEVDHIEPHRGDLKKFRDRKNWQGLCKSCHSRKTASEVLNG